MTEEEWLRTTDSGKMLEFIRGIASERKLRLYFCQSARNVRHLLTDSRSWDAVEVAEQYADGLASSAELDTAHTAACEAARSQTGLPNMADEQVDFARSSWHAALSAQTEIKDDWTMSRKVLEPNEASLLRGNWLRDIFGNPFRPITLSPSWLTSTVVPLAMGIYSEKAFDRMPILADALQDAGCNNEDVLNHCRQPGEHVRGCFVVDRLTGKS